MTGHSADRPAEALPTVGIVVVSYGSHELLAANLVSPGQANRNTRVVVVDNYHSAAERAAVTLLAAERGWALLPMDENLGFGLAVNIGVDHAKTLGCEQFLLLNPDACVSAEVIDALRLECDRDPMTMVAPLIVRPDGRVWFKGNKIDPRNGSVGSADDFGAVGANGWLTGAAMMVHLTLWDKIGGFDPDYFLYWEDIDLSRRCWAVGGKLLVRSDLSAVHDVGGTQQKAQPSEVKSTLYFYYNCRNRLVFAAKQLPATSAMYWVLVTPVQSYRILARMGRRQLLRSPRHLWAGVSGSVNGFGFLAAALIRRLPFISSNDKNLRSVPDGSMAASGGNES